MREHDISTLPTAMRCRDLAGSSDASLRVVAKALDLPMEDSESVDFLRCALKESERELRIAEMQWRIDRLKESNQ